MGMPEISRRANSLGTENAFVVLAEVNALARQGKDIVSFCIGQPDFPAPSMVMSRVMKKGALRLLEDVRDEILRRSELETSK